jgi:rhomboid domain-containing protein 1
MRPGDFVLVGGGGRGGRRGPASFVLAAQLLQRIVALERKPPVTILIIAVQIVVYALVELNKSRMLPAGHVPISRVVLPWISVQNGCLNPSKVLLGQRYRLVLASFVHLSDTHLLYNMLSFVHKGVTLETELGSVTFAALVIYLGFISHALYTIFAISLAHAGISNNWINKCVAGFSGVIFGLSTVLNMSADYRDAAESIFQVRLPLQAAVFELALAQVLVPNASFAGHLCGVIAGFGYVALGRSLSHFIISRPPTGGRARSNFGSGTTVGHQHRE